MIGVPTRRSIVTSDYPESRCRRFFTLYRGWPGRFGDRADAGLIATIENHEVAMCLFGLVGTECWTRSSTNPGVNAIGAARRPFGL